MFSHYSIEFVPNGELSLVPYMTKYLGSFGWTETRSHSSGYIFHTSLDWEVDFEHLTWLEIEDLRTHTCDFGTLCLRCRYNGTYGVGYSSEKFGKPFIRTQFLQDLRKVALDLAAPLPVEASRVTWWEHLRNGL